MAVAVRGGKDALSEVVMHTDQGREYTAKNFRAALRSGRDQTVDGPGRPSTGQCRDRQLALDRGVRAAQLEHFT